MHLGVLGAGELGLACGLAVHAAAKSSQRDARVTLFNRDGVLKKAQEKLLQTAASTRSNTTSRNEEGALLPAKVQLRALSSSTTVAMSSPESAHLEGSPSGVFVCTPISALVADEPLGTHGAGNKDPATAPPPLLQEFLAACSWQSSTSEGHHTHPFCACFTRGFSAEGKTATELVQGALLRGEHEGRVTPPVYAMCGPILPKEWLQDNATPTSAEAARNGSHRPYSGVTFTMGLCAPSPHARDAGFHDAMEGLFCNSLFPREGVVYDRDPAAGEVLSIVNGCLPLCAFGAGLVGNAFSGANVSALAAYAQHCVTATAALVNALVDGRPRDAPLPVGACTALFSACHVFSSKEFSLGRQMDFQFRQLDAVQAVYPGRSHQAFSATVDGLHTRMRARHVSSPFYEVLMDTFGTVVRASTAGRGLVKQGVYDYRECPSSPLLEHAMRVDEAMLSGDEARFEEAKRKLEETFSFYPVSR